MPCTETESIDRPQCCRYVEEYLDDGTVVRLLEKAGFDCALWDVKARFSALDLVNCSPSNLNVFLMEGHMVHALMGAWSVLHLSDCGC